MSFMSPFDSYQQVFAFSIGVYFLVLVTIKLLHDIHHYCRSHILPRVKSTDFSNIYGKWAIVTGPTSGVGEGIAKALARRGMNLVLVARNEKKIQSLVSSLESTYRVEYKAVIANLAERDAYQKVYEAVKDLDVGILVNNIGMNTLYAMQSLSEVDENYLWNMLNVNCGSGFILTNLLLPKLINKNKGIVLNVCSTSSYFPIPYQAVYSSTKVFMDVLTRSLNKELSERGVHVQSLCPLLVNSNMTAGTPAHHSIITLDATKFGVSVAYTIGMVQRTTGHYISDFLVWALNALPQKIATYFLYLSMLLVRRLMQSNSEITT